MKKVIQFAKKSEKLPYVLVRCAGAGVHAGELVSRKGDVVELRNSRRIWRWEGAASLSELAVFGAKAPTACRFAVIVERIVLLGAVEVIHCTSAGEQMIRSCPEWRA